jgi:hypothetical protein
MRAEVRHRGHRFNRAALLAVALVGLALYLGPAAAAQACTPGYSSSPPGSLDHMTYAAEGSPSQNFGTNDYWRVGGNSSGQRWFGYIKSSTGLPDIPAGCYADAGYIVLSAATAIDSNGNMVLNPSEWAGAGIPQIDVSAAGDSWGQWTLTWNNRPSFTGGHLTGYPAADSLWLQVPNDSLLAMYLGSLTNYGWVLRPSGGTAGAYWKITNNGNTQFIVHYS